MAALALAALMLWKLGGLLLLLFAAILLAIAFNALADGLRRLMPLPRKAAILLSAALIFGVLGAVIALYGWRIQDHQDLPTSDRLLPGYGGGPPRFFGPRAWAVITVSGLLLAAMIYIGFESALGPDNRVEHARALALGALIAASAVATAALSGLRTWTARIVSGASVVSLVALVQTPVLARLVTLEPLHLDDWARVAVAGAAAGVFALVVKGALTERAPKPA